jgi:hypothetical protein
MWLFVFIYLENTEKQHMQKGSGIILSGNRQLAAQFVKISKRKLYDMKQMMRLTGQMMMQRVFYLDRDCVWVRIYIIDNAEFIRIHACAEDAGKCKLTTTITPLGSKQVRFEYTYEFDDDSSNQAVYVDTGGKFLSGNNRYFSNTFNAEGKVNTTKTFLNTGDHTIFSFAQANDTIISHDSGTVGSPTYSVAMDVSSISPKASLHMQKPAGLNAVNAYANGVLVGTFNDATHRGQIITLDVPVIDTMNMFFEAVTGNVQWVRIFFRQYDCFKTNTQIITVT